MLPKQMMAVTRTEYGPPDCLRIEQVARPEPIYGEVLVKVRAASINAGDHHAMRGRPLVMRVMTRGLVAPEAGRLGADLAGEVVRVGGGVTRFRPGDAVFGRVLGFGQLGEGAFAEYARTRETLLTHKPANVSFERAAAAPLAALTALQGLRDHGRIRAGQRVLITGAASGVGTFAVQIAKALGAEVTAACSTKGIEKVRALGAAHVIDTSREDPVRMGRRFDVVLDIACTRSPSESMRLLEPRGRYVFVGAPSSGLVLGAMRPVVRVTVASWFAREARMSTLVEKPNQADLKMIADLLESGVLTSVVDRTYPLREAAEAMRYFETAHPVGKVVLTVGE